MLVAHVSQTPVAGAAWAWAEAFRQAGLESFCLAPAGYADGRAMPRHEDWPPGERQVEMIRSADVIFCHQGHPYRYEWYPRDRPTVVVYHSQPWRVNRAAENDGWPAACLGQYHTRLYPALPPVPNLVPLRHAWFQPRAKPTDCVRIVYSPGNPDGRGWDDKGRERTVDIVRQVAQRHGPACEFGVITGAALQDCLRRKATAHVAIDECVTGSYHRCSLEALALGCVVINACDGGCAANIRRMTGGCGHPFRVCRLPALAGVLEHLLELGGEALRREGARNRAWMEGAWGPDELIERNFMPLIEAARARAKGRGCSLATGGGRT